MNHKSQTNNYTDFFYHFSRNILFVSIPLVFISALILSSSFSQAEPSHVNKDQVSLNILPSCTLSVDQSVSTPHTISILNGTYESDIGKTRVAAFCNDANGYNIYAIGYTNNEDGNTKLIGRSLNVNGGLLGNEYDINTGTAISGNTSNWAMKLTGGTGVDAPTIRQLYTDYANVPSTLTMVAHRESGTHMSSSDAVGAYFDTTYRAYVTSSQPAGTYTGQVKYVLDHPYSSDPLYDIEDAYYAFGNEKVYLMNDGTVHREMPAEEHGGLAGRYYAMQDMNNPICSTVEVLGDNGAAQLVDMRDGKLYWAAKLKDEHCWMTQNLDLDIVVGSTNLNSNNTDLSTNESVYTNTNTIYTLKGTGDTYGYTYENGVATWIPERTTIVYNQLNSTNWQNSNTDPYSYDYLDNNGNPVYPDNNVTQAIAGNHGLAGNYYNWTASLASNDSTNATGNPTNSICPKGWRLPNITNQEFGNLLVQYNIISTNTSTSYIENVSSVDSMGAAPLYFVRGGFVNSGSLNGAYGGYWSSTSTDSSKAYRLLYSYSTIRPRDNDNKGIGWFIRCLVR